MTLSSAFLANNGYQTAAEDFRNFVNSTFGRAQGLHFNTDLALTPGAGLSMNYAPGAITVQGMNLASQGAYFVWDSAGGNIPWPAANGSNPRIDALVMFVCDSQYGSASVGDGPQWTIVQGTPAGSPSAPTDATIISALPGPGGWYRMANVTIPTAATGILSGNIAVTGWTGGGYSFRMNSGLGAYNGGHAEGVIMTIVVPRNSMRAGSVVKFEVSGTLTGATGSNYPLGKIRIGATAGVGGTLLTSTNDPGVWETYSNSGWMIEGSVYCVNTGSGTSGTYNANLRFSLGQYTTNPGFYTIGVSGNIGVDTTTDQILSITGLTTTGALAAWGTNYGYAINYG